MTWYSISQRKKELLSDNAIQELRELNVNTKKIVTVMSVDQLK